MRYDDTIDVQMSSPVGPRVITGKHADCEDIVRAIPQGWSVAWENQVETDSHRWSYPLVHQVSQCAYCFAEVENNPDVSLPAVDDDEGWAREAEQHNEGCNWIKTRAHRLDR